VPGWWPKNSTVANRLPIFRRLTPAANGFARPVTDGQLRHVEVIGACRA
jgi:hypothetical protein